MNVQDFEQHVKASLEKHLDHAHLTVPGAVLVACDAVECFSRDNPDRALAGVDKKRIASVLVPTVISAAVHNGYLSREEGDHLEDQLNMGAGILGALIDTYVFIANQPQLLQIQAELKRRCVSCLGRKKE